MSIERKITLGFLLAVMVQLAGTLVWAGAAAERLSTIEHIQELRQPAFERLARALYGQPCHLKSLASPCNGAPEPGVNL